MADQPDPAADIALLDGIDAAFQAVLHGRYGGGIAVTCMKDAASGAERILRMPPAGTDDRVRLLLYGQGTAAGQGTGRGTTIGQVALSAAAAGEVTIVAEIFEPWDPNEAADARFLDTGLLFKPLSGAMAGALGVVRSSEAGLSGGQQAQRAQRGWLPGTERNRPSRGLGLGNNGHRRSPGCTMQRSVTQDLLSRLGGVVAASGGDAKDAPGCMALMIETGGGTL